MKTRDKLVVGTGKAQVTVPRLDKRNARLKPVNITEIKDMDPMDPHRVRLDVFKRLDFTIY